MSKKKSLVYRDYVDSFLFWFHDLFSEREEGSKNRELNVFSKDKARTRKYVKKEE